MTTYLSPCGCRYFGSLITHACSSHAPFAIGIAPTAAQVLAAIEAFANRRQLEAVAA